MLVVQQRCYILTRSATAGSCRRCLGFTAAQAPPIHPVQSEREAMLKHVAAFLDRLEQKPPPIAGSGYKWIVDPEATDERKANQAIVDSLPLAIGKNQFPGGLAEILKQVIEPGVSCSTDDNSPGYMAYIPSGGLYHSAVADFLSTAVNRYVTIDQAAPVFAAIERECVKWMCEEVVGWPASGPSGGVLAPGGAMANLFALHAARSSKIRNAELPKATVYVSEQAHYCIDMGAKFIGVSPSLIRKVPSNPSDMSMNLENLTQMLEADMANGLVPIAVCAMAGTTNSGAIDDLEAISEICTEKNIWMHVDGAYGGFFALTDKGRTAMKGMEKADSIVMDPHKSLFLPYGLGALLVRNQFSLQKGNISDGACMQPPPADSIAQVEDIMNLSPELTRNFRGLRMWLPLQVLGVDAFRTQLEEKLALAQYAATVIGDGSIPNLRIVAQPQLSIFTFKLDDGVKKGAELDALNAEFLNHIHTNGNVVLSPFRSVQGIPGELCIRMAILSHRTDLQIVNTAIADVRAAALKAQGLTIKGDARTGFLTSAADDFVKDYRELAKMDIWDELLHSAPGSVRVLDTCAGTGRWAQTFSEVLVKDSSVSTDFLDMCSDSMAVLSKRVEGLGNLGVGKCYVGDICDLGELGVPSLTYDIIVNMHGLYGVSKARLPLALQAMHDALKPGGTMVIAIATIDSPYQQVCIQCNGRDFHVSDQDVLQALGGLGIQSTTRHIEYMEEFAAADKAGLERFLVDECSGNSFSVDKAESMPEAQMDIQKYADGHFHQSSGTYRFNQKIAVITVHRDADFLPEMLSFGPFYSEAYNLRRAASTMQINMIEWLRSNTEKQILQKCSAEAGKPLRICSIGCGDGELDIALMEGIVNSVGFPLVSTSPFSGIDFVGLEPSSSLRQKFMDNVVHSKARGALLSDQCTIRLEAEAFEPNRGSKHLNEGEADIVLLGHVLYYFQDKAEAVRRAMRLMRPGGVTVVVHQCKQGVPELQEALLPKLRGTVRDMFSADDIEDLFKSSLEKNVSHFDRHDVDAFLDVAEIAKGSSDGIKIMSFCLEADHRSASIDVLKMSRDSFAGMAVPHAEAGRIGGPFLREPVSCFVVSAPPEQEVGA